MLLSELAVLFCGFNRWKVENAYSGSFWRDQIAKNGRFNIIKNHNFHSSFHGFFHLFNILRKMIYN